MSERPEIHGALMRWPGWKMIGAALLGFSLGYAWAALFYWLGMRP